MFYCEQQSIKLFNFLKWQIRRSGFAEKCMLQPGQDRQSITHHTDIQPCTYKLFISQAYQHELVLYSLTCCRIIGQNSDKFDPN